MKLDKCFFFRSRLTWATHVHVYTIINGVLYGVSELIPLRPPAFDLPSTTPVFLFLFLFLLFNLSTRNSPRSLPFDPLFLLSFPLFLFILPLFISS